MTYLDSWKSEPWINFLPKHNLTCRVGFSNQIGFNLLLRSQVWFGFDTCNFLGRNFRWKKLDLNEYIKADMFVTKRMKYYGYDLDYFQIITFKYSIIIFHIALYLVWECRSKDLFKVPVKFWLNKITLSNISYSCFKNQISILRLNFIQIVQGFVKW